MPRAPPASMDTSAAQPAPADHLRSAGDGSIPPPPPPPSVPEVAQIPAAEMLISPPVADEGSLKPSGLPNLATPYGQTQLPVPSDHPNHMDGASDSGPLTAAPAPDSGPLNAALSHAPGADDTVTSIPDEDIEA